MSQLVQLTVSTFALDLVIQPIIDAGALVLGHVEWVHHFWLQVPQIRFAYYVPRRFICGRLTDVIPHSQFRRKLCDDLFVLFLEGAL